MTTLTAAAYQQGMAVHAGAHLLNMQGMGGLDGGGQGRARGKGLDVGGQKEGTVGREDWGSQGGIGGDKGRCGGGKKEDLGRWGVGCWGQREELGGAGAWNWGGEIWSKKETWGDGGQKRRHRSGGLYGDVGGGKREDLQAEGQDMEGRGKTGVGVHLWGEGKCGGVGAWGLERKIWAPWGVGAGCGGAEGVRRKIWGGQQVEVRADPFKPVSLPPPQAALGGTAAQGP